jgi:hypothetical protein
VDPNDPDKTDLEAIQAEDVKTVAKRRQKLGEWHCFDCGLPINWAYECPQLSGEQQAQLHMNLDAQEDGAEGQAVKEGHQLMHVSFNQGGELPDDRAYLDGCSTVTAFKNGKFLRDIHSVREGIKINCNAGAVTTNKKGRFGGLSAWYLPDGITNIFSMHELEKLYRITYNSWEGFYIVHTLGGEVHFHKDEQGLPFINLARLGHEAAKMLLQLAAVARGDKDDVSDEGTAFVQMVRGNYEGYTKREMLRAKEACRGQNPTWKSEQEGLSRDGEQQHDCKLPGFHI